MGAREEERKRQKQKEIDYRKLSAASTAMVISGEYLVELKL